MVYRFSPKVRRRSFSKRQVLEIDLYTAIFFPAWKLSNANVVDFILIDLDPFNLTAFNLTDFKLLDVQTD